MTSISSSERKAKIESYGRAPELLEAALKEFPREMWQYKTAPDRWSIHEIIVHLADAEANSYVRARRMIAEPGGTLMAYDQDLWAQKLDYHSQSTEDAVALFSLLRKTTYDLIRALPDSVWAHAATHPEYGAYGFERWLDIYERHTAGHIAQMRANYDAWKKQQSAQAAASSS
jgi:hypothetical protein